MSNMPGMRVQRDNKIRKHWKYPWATCNLDRLIVGGDEPIILELKTTTSYAVKNWDAAVPTVYYSQVQWQMFVTGHKKAILWIAVLDTKKFIRLDVDRSDEFIKVMLEEVLKFVDAVERNDPSGLAVTAKDTDKMKPKAGTKIQASEEILSKITQLSEIKLTIAEAKKAEKALSEEVKVFIGDNENLVDDERVLATYTTVAKAAFSVPASTSRVLNIQREKKARK